MLTKWFFFVPTSWPSTHEGVPNQPSNLCKPMVHPHGAPAQFCATNGICHLIVVDHMTFICLRTTNYNWTVCAIGTCVPLAYGTKVIWFDHNVLRWGLSVCPFACRGLASQWHLHPYKRWQNVTIVCHCSLPLKAL